MICMALSVSSFSVVMFLFFSCSRPGKFNRAWKACLHGRIINFVRQLKRLMIMCRFIEFWTADDNGIYKRMIVNVAHIVWFKEKDGKAVIYLSSHPDRGIETDHPFAMLYEDLTGEKELGDIEG